MGAEIESGGGEQALAELQHGVGLGADIAGAGAVYRVGGKCGAVVFGEMAAADAGEAQAGGGGEGDAAEIDCRACLQAAGEDVGAVIGFEIGDAGGAGDVAVGAAVVEHAA